MMTHVKVLAWFNIALGALGLLAGAAVFGGAMVVTDIFLFAVGAILAFAVNVAVEGIELVTIGYILMGAGHSIAVQNFNENLSILAMTGIYYAMVKADLSIYWVITLFGIFVSGAMYFVKRLHAANQRVHDDVIHLDDSAHH